MSKTVNHYLRYYLGDAANGMKNITLNTERTVKRSITKFRIINKKALALIPRKFVRLVYELLVNNQLYYGVSLGASIKESK